MLVCMDATGITLLTAATSTVGALTGVLISTVFTKRSNEKQARMQTALKLAEFRQAWIDNLRDTMAEFQSLGVTPGLEHIRRPEFFQSGTRIQLLMNRDDPEYAVLDECLYNFLMADTEQEKYRSNPDYIDVCQRILKREEERLRKDLEGVALSK